MGEARLRTVARTQGNNAALKDGTVSPRTFSFDFEEVPVLVQAFRRMVRTLEFDICEMAFTTYLCAKEHGTRFTALPVFLARGFHHGAIVRGAQSDVRTPADLEGRRVGVNRGYTVTTGVWARAILADEHGVDLERVTWARSGDEHVAEYRPPDNVVSLEPGKDLSEVVATGELPAAVGITADSAGLEPLIGDPEEAAFTALRERGLYPINHLVVVRDDLLNEHPELAADAFDAFVRAKDLYVRRLRDGSVESPTATDRRYRRVLDLLGDPLPYGIEPNRPMIERLVEAAVSQRILRRAPSIEELFAPGTHDLTG